MSAASKYFDTGIVAGGLAGARTHNAYRAANGMPLDPSERRMEANLRASLVKLGVINEGDELPSDAEIAYQIGERSAEFYSACFQIGSMFELLQIHIRLASLGVARGIPNEAWQVSNESLVPLVTHLPVLFDQISAPQGAKRYLQCVSDALADMNEWRAIAAELSKEGMHVVALLRSYLETVQLESAPHVIGTLIEEYVVGDKFENISHATIINRSTVDKAFNRYERAGDGDIAIALKRIGDHVNQSGNVAAATVFDQFTLAIAEEKPDRSRVRQFWDGLVAILPSVNSVADAAAAIAKLLG